MVEETATLEDGTWNIRGVKISDHFIRAMGEGGYPVGSIVKIIKRDDGVVTVERMDG